MRSQKEKHGEIGDDYIPGNMCGPSTAGIEMLSGGAKAYGLEDVRGSATPLNNVCVSASIRSFLLCSHIHHSISVVEIFSI